MTATFIAFKADVHRNTVQGVRGDAWNPTIKTLEAILAVVQKIEAGYTPTESGDLRPPATQAEKGEAGMRAAEDHAERDEPGWKGEALRYLRRFVAENRGRDFLAEEIAPWAYERGCTKAPDDRAWGGIIQRAGRLKIMEQTGLAAKNKLSGHSSTWRPLWRAV